MLKIAGQTTGVELLVNSDLCQILGYSLATGRESQNYSVKKLLFCQKSRTDVAFKYGQFFCT